MKSRIQYINLLNTLSAFAVVALHVNGVFWSFSYGRYWITANIIESVMYFAVPVFFMITGATLMDYLDKYTTKEFFRKRIRKSVIPFLVWSIIAYVYFVLRGKATLVSPLILFQNVLNSKVLSIYWFFPALFSIYLSIPVLASIAREKKIRVLEYYVLAAFLFNSLLPLLAKLLIIQWNGSFNFAIGTGYLIYPALGYIFHNTELNKKTRMIIYVASILALALHIGGVWYGSYKLGSIDATFKGYTNVPCILYSIGVYVFIKSLVSAWGERLKIIINASTRLSKYTFGVYLVHWFVMSEIVRVFSINTASIVYRTVGTVIVFSISVFVVYAIKKIPFLKKIIPS